MDALDQNLEEENNWLVPPPRLLLICFNKMRVERVTGVLIRPQFESREFWPIFKVFQSLNYITILDVLPRVWTIVSGKGYNMPKS